ncbi:pentatricopeptide repeat-containing protein At2g35030, mitochondrial [Selaginella moellendorffii]|uniref:pentatricopeptide repeat-containing protein At2g35030, mitochondrial n=1 Tax=Selaginella moellendorffii TaxID=88036 RepID=UPI000D1CD5BB|nr:pentatricopeptide repeat-containing protein At2g35030, mitochondrial [Selaginella moellendorffii]|eukprot:XP_024515205.1 pentatricopeptide repeat-containing protein At2g35030, mitochondrial [Selaginella moellendorffii]
MQAWRRGKGDAIRWMRQKLRDGEWAIWGALAGECLADKGKMEVEIAIEGGLADAVDRLEETENARVSSSSYALLIRQCGDSGDLGRGKRVHDHISRSGRDGETFLGNLVVEMYGKLGCVSYARAAFDRISQPNAFSVNLVLAACAKRQRTDEAQGIFERFSSVADAVAWNTMIVAYAQPGHLLKAMSLFDSMPGRNVVSWNSIVNGVLQHGCAEDAVTMMNKMPQHSLASWNAAIVAYAEAGHLFKILEFFLSRPERDLISWIETIRCLSKNGSVDDSKRLFDAMPQWSVAVWIALLQAYAQSGHIDIAGALFDEIPEKSLVSWNAMIWAYAINQIAADAKKLFDALPEMDVISCNTMISAFASSHSVREASQVFESMPARDTVSWNALLQGYADEESASFESARALFERMSHRSLLGWNLMLKASMQQGEIYHAEEIFHEMPGRNFSSWNALHGGYVENGVLSLAVAAMDRMPAMDRVVWTVMIGGYARAGFLAEGEEMVERMPDRDVVAWNSLLQSHVEHGAQIEDAKRIFDGMAERNIVSWSAMIGAFVRPMKQQKLTIKTRVEMAKSVFERMPSRDIVSSNAMVVFLADNGLIEEARTVVESMDRKNSLSWSALLEGYVKKGCNREALELYRSMDLEAQSNPQSSNSRTFVWILEACARSVALNAGRSIHSDLDDLLARNHGSSSVLLAPSLATALIDMYGKCGELDEARKIFDGLSCKSISCWNSMIAAYTQSGHGKQALELFLLMGLDGLNPNHITLMIVLSACSHSGLVSTALDFFLASILGRDFGSGLIRKEHFACLIDLLGRAGQLQEAQELMAAMPVEPDRVAWSAMLGACKAHGDGDRGAAAAERVIQLDPSSSSPYVAVSSMHKQRV